MKIVGLLVTAIIGLVVYFALEQGWLPEWTWVIIATIAALLAIIIVRRYILRSDSFGKYDIVLSSLIFMGVVSAICGWVGLGVDGVSQTVVLPESDPGVFGAMEWAFDGLGFFLDALTFQVSGTVPAIIGLVFWTFIGLDALVIISLIRGTD